MTPQELKNSILQLAIQGKLVEQRAEEGTAEEIFAQIQQEKQRLIAEKKIKKEKPLPEITEEEKPFDIPESWKWVRIGEIFGLQAGKNITSANIYEEKSAQNPYLCFGGNGARGFVSTYNREGHFVLIGRQGALCGNINLADGKFYATEHAVVVDHYNIADVLWCGYFLKALNLNKYATATAQPGLAVANIVKVLIPLPPLAEQKRIVAKIEELLPYIARYEQAWSKLEKFNSRFPEDMKKSLLQYAIQGKLVEQRAEEGTAEELFAKIQEEKQRLIAEKKIKKEKPLPKITEEEKPFDIPESWKWVRVASIVELNPKNSLEDSIDVAFIPMACIADGYRNQHTFEVRKWGEIKKGFTHFANDDIGIAKITPCFQNKKSVIFSNLQNGYGAGTTELSIVRVINDLISREYMLWFFKSAYFIENGIKSFTGTAGQQRIHKDYLANCVFPLPPLAEQKRIVEKLEQLLLLCERLK